MNRKTLIALLLFVALGAVVLVLRYLPEEGERVGKRPRPIAKIEPAEVTRLTVTTREHSLTLARQPKGWRLTAPVDYPSDKHAAKAALDKIGALEFGDLVTERTDRHADLEVDASGVHVEVFGKSGRLADFVVGKVINNFTMLRPSKGNKVYQAVGALRRAFDRPLRSWRDRKILKLKRDDVVRLELAGRSGTVVLKRPKAPGPDAKAKRDKPKARAKRPWQLVSSPLEIAKLDQNAVNGVVSRLQSLNAFDFADKIEDAKAGLDKPRMTITAQLSDGKRHQLVIGGKREKAKDETYARLAGSPQVFVLKKYTVKNMLLRPIDLRDKQVLELEREKLSSVTFEKLDDKTKLTLTRKGKGWLANGKKAKNPDAVGKVIGALARLKADGFARHSAEELGLDKPKWRVLIRLKKSPKPLELTVGSKDQAGMFGARLRGREELFLFRKYRLTTFLLDPKDFAR